MKQKTKKHISISKISILHYYKLIGRSILLIAAIILYILNHLQRLESVQIILKYRTLFLMLIWILFAIEMALRFFPSHLESMGCQKQFSKNYIPTQEPPEKAVLQSNRVTLLIAIGWLCFNGIFAVLYYVGIFDAGLMMLICLFFSVCDMICILFFCPFQTWFMKNKCCTTCRIYNWDFAMMFTPLLFIPNLYNWSLLALSLLLVLRWEIAIHRHPERFSENTNRCLSCKECGEKLCHHKKQLHGFLLRNRKHLQLKGNQLFHGDNHADKTIQHSQKTKQ